MDRFDIKVMKKKLKSNGTQRENMKKVVIIDYDVGNQQSLKNTHNKINVNLNFSNKEDIKNSDDIILPGVGSFNKIAKY